MVTAIFATLIFPLVKNQCKLQQKTVDRVSGFYFVSDKRSSDPMQCSHRLLNLSSRLDKMH
ncbi:hypothetical protein SSYIS1_25470 [Serratia symbiotica]|uniref:Uncharacterized protein n=1 Tax=Serratia symbiotica TaxID=138074 RepID=A0A455VI03_9GAMM|nr:hypothetical protein SSYIS1_25470 [Serratia symbiotica]